MNLINKMLGMEKTENYFFVEYNTLRGVGVISLVVKNDELYHDIKNNRTLDCSSIKFKKQLTDYVQIQEEKISKNKAKKLAEPFYEDFFEEWHQLFSTDKEYIIDDDYTFYAMV